MLAVVANPLIASLWVCALADKALSPATYSVLNADALEDEKAVWVEVANLFPILVAILAEKLGSSFNAAASSSRVSNVAGAELTIPATLASIYVFCELLNAVSAALYSVLKAVAAEEEWTFTTAILWVWADADVAPPALAAWAEALSTATLAILSVWAEADKAVSPATYSVLIAVAIEEDKLLLAVVANPLTASLWVCADALNTDILATLSACVEADAA